MTGMEAMIFSWNQLTGTIPTELALLTNVTEIALNDNLLEGTLPPELGTSLTKLSDFFAHNNPGITGQVPESYGNFQNISTYIFTSQYRLIPVSVVLTKLLYPLSRIFASFQYGLEWNHARLDLRGSWG